MTLLRVSGEHNGLDVDLDAALDRDHLGEVGVPAGPALLAFANAVELGGDVDGCRRAVARELGTDAATEAAAIIAIFNGLVRVADGTGIPLDAGVFAASAQDRDRLGINDYAGAVNSAGIVVGDDREAAGVDALFG